jgi:hypothetical protein
MADDLVPPDYRPGSPPESIVDAVNQAAWEGFPARTLEFVYPAGALTAAVAERDRLADVIDRAAAEIDAIPEADVMWWAEQLWHDARAKRIAGALLEARKILAEAEPEDLEVTDE